MVGRLPGRFLLTIEGGGEPRDDLVFSARRLGTQAPTHFTRGMGATSSAEFGPVEPGEWSVALERKDGRERIVLRESVIITPGGTTPVSVAAADLFPPANRGE